MRAPELIQSRDNPLIKRIRSLQSASARKRERAFVVEGLRAVDDAVAIGAHPQALVLREDFDRGKLSPALAAVPARIATARLFDEVAGAETPQGILAILPIPQPPPGPADPSLTVVVDALRDPGNLGTLLRSCAAAGVTGVLYSHGTVDTFNPKVVRSAMGAHFRVPIQALEPRAMAGSGIPGNLIVADSSGSIPYYDVDMTGPVTIVIGSEAHGVSEKLLRQASSVVSIPMATGTESLNAAVAGSVLLFEAVRQRHRKGLFGTISA